MAKAEAERLAEEQRLKPSVWRKLKQRLEAELVAKAEASAGRRAGLKPSVAKAEAARIEAELMAKAEAEATRLEIIEQKRLDAEKLLLAETQRIRRSVQRVSLIQ